MDKDELLRGLTEIATICSRLLNEVCKEPPKVIEEMGKLVYVDFRAKRRLRELPEKETFGEFLRYWYDTFVCGKIRPSTAQNYELYLFGDITERLGSYPLERITPEILQNYLESVEKSNTRAKQGFLINRAFNKAVALGKIERNPYAAIEPLAHNTVHYRHLEFSEQEKMYEYFLKDEKYKAVFMILCCTGLRIGEFLALDLEKDVDFEEGVIRVSKSVDTRSGELRVWTKTESGRRSVPVLEELKEYFDTLKSLESPVTYSAVRSTFRRAYSRLGIAGANLHSLRHTFLSLCYLAGVKPKFMQVIAGHSKFEMTMNVYTHMLKKGKSHILTYIRKLAAYIEDNYI